MARGEVQNHNSNPWVETKKTSRCASIVWLQMLACCYTTSQPASPLCILKTALLPWQPIHIRLSSTLRGQIWETNQICLHWKECLSSPKQTNDTYSSLGVGLEKNSSYSWCSSWHTWTMKAQPLRTWGNETIHSVNMQTHPPPPKKNKAAGSIASIINETLFH